MPKHTHKACKQNGLASLIRKENNPAFSEILLLSVLLQPKPNLGKIIFSETTYPIS